MVKKKDTRTLKEVTITKEDCIIPDGWQMVKEPTKMQENGNDVFKIVIAK